MVRGYLSKDNKGVFTMQDVNSKEINEVKDTIKISR